MVYEEKRDGNATKKALGKKGLFGPTDKLWASPRETFNRFKNEKAEKVAIVMIQFRITKKTREGGGCH